MKDDDDDISVEDMALAERIVERLDKWMKCEHKWGPHYKDEDFGWSRQCLECGTVTIFMNGPLH
jgi:hypothetical protein